MWSIVKRIFKEVLNWSFFRKLIATFFGMAFFGFLIQIATMTVKNMGSSFWAVLVQSTRAIIYIWKNRD
jgi:hypothetical protein